MVIEKLHTDETERNVCYAVCADQTETGDKLHEIIRLNKLEEAVIVMRYMRGDSLTESEEYRAKEAIRKADAPTDKRKRTRKAE